MQEEITLAFGNQISLTKDKKTNKEIFIKIAPAFRLKQLKELKGSCLSIFLCYALHANGRGYTWVDDRVIKKETGYINTSEARQKLIKMHYLYQMKVRNSRGQLRDWIYRIFQPIEPDKKFLIRNEELWTPKSEKADIGNKGISVKNTPILEGEPYIEEEPYTSVAKIRKVSKTSSLLHTQVKEFFSFYREQFLKRISSTPPIFNWGACERLAKPHINQLTLPVLKKLLVKYLTSNNQLFKDNAYSLSCFLSTKIIHQLMQGVK